MENKDVLESHIFGSPPGLKRIETGKSLSSAHLATRMPASNVARQTGRERYKHVSLTFIL